MGAHIPRRIYVRRPSLAVARWQLQGQGRFRFESGLHIVKVKQSICFSRTSIVFYNSYSISLSLTVRFLKVCLFFLPSVFLCLSLSFPVSPTLFPCIYYYSICNSSLKGTLLRDGTDFRNTVFVNNF